jgi:hypothetical protein
MKILAGCISAFLIVTPGGTAFAQAMCSRPLSPTCATYSGTFAEPSAILRCRKEIATHRARMLENQTCLLKQVEEDLMQASDVERVFECRAVGEKSCVKSSGDTRSAR